MKGNKFHGIKFVAKYILVKMPKTTVFCDYFRRCNIAIRDSVLTIMLCV